MALLPAGLAVDRPTARRRGATGGCIIRDTASRRRRVPVLRALVRPIQNILFLLPISMDLAKIHQAARRSQGMSGAHRRRSNFAQSKFMFFENKNV